MTGDDPRLDEEYVRRSVGRDAEGDVLLVGVVHDHPASAYRVREVVRSERPAVLALELAPLALPLFERYAELDRTATAANEGEYADGTEGADEAEDAPPARGGEMSAAIDAAETDRVAGIDGPSRGFLWTLVRTLYREDAAAADVRRVVRRFAGISKHVLACRFAALVGLFRDAPPAVENPTEHEAEWTDPPAEQAADEQTQVRRAASVLNAFESPSHARVRDETREAHMADRLATLRQDGDVVAVVGMGHLDAVHDRLESS